MKRHINGRAVASLALRRLAQHGRSRGRSMPVAPQFPRGGPPVKWRMLGISVTLRRAGLCLTEAFHPNRERLVAVEHGPAVHI